MAKVKIPKERCKGCYLCIVNCPSGCIKVSGELNEKGIKPVIFSGGKCSGCTMCALICPECIIEVFK